MDAVDRVLDHLDTADPGGVLGVYRYGSSVLGGLRPDSDVDLLVVTERSLDRGERKALVGLLLQVSGRRATLVPGRPLEVTCVVLSDVAPWRYPPVCDLQYGEWLRTEITETGPPSPHVSPDLAVLLTTVQEHAEVLRGPSPRSLLTGVPPADLRRAVMDSLDPLLDDLVGDERNVLLTLARMIVTLESGEIVSKDEAVRRVLPTVDDHSRAVLAYAAAGYLGEVDDDWTSDSRAAGPTAQLLAGRIRSADRCGEDDR